MAYPTLNVIVNEPSLVMLKSSFRLDLQTTRMESFCGEMGGEGGDVMGMNAGTSCTW